MGEDRNEYLYSTSGVKLQVVQRYNSNYNTAPINGTDINLTALDKKKTTDYVGNKIYEDDKLKRILVDGGYIEGGVYYFYLNDHLGNNRVVANQSGTAIQKTHYYPFRQAFAEGLGDDVQPYKYNGKELDKMHGLNMYDYSARHYDAAIGRFTTIDPLAEKYYSISPYAYCANNPMRFIDVKGLYPQSVLIKYQDHYKFTAPVARLLSLVSGVSEIGISNVKIVERSKGRQIPAYDANKGGGAMTFGTRLYNASIIYTQNFLEDNPQAYSGHGYGKNTYSWLSLSAHEVGHLNHVEDAGSLLNYLASFGIEYARYGHDNSPREKEADRGYNEFQAFNSYIGRIVGVNALISLIDSQKSDQEKIDQINKWFDGYQFNKENKTKSFLDLINNNKIKDGTYKWDGNDWVRQ